MILHAACWALFVCSAVRSENILPNPRNASTNRTTSSADSATGFVFQSLSHQTTSNDTTVLSLPETASSSHTKSTTTSSRGPAFYINQGFSASSQDISAGTSFKLESNAPSTSSSVSTGDASDTQNPGTTLPSGSPQSTAVHVVSISIFNKTSNATSSPIVSTYATQYHASASSLSSLHSVWTAPSRGYGISAHTNQSRAGTGTAPKPTITSKPQLPSLSQCSQLSLADWKPPVSIGGSPFGPEWVSSCQAAGHAYIAANSSFLAALRLNQESEIGVSQSPIEWNSTAVYTKGIYTLCDGYPRFNNNEPLWQFDTTSYYFSGFVNMTTTSSLAPVYPQSCILNGSTPKFTGTAPSECSSMPASACATLWEEWSNEYSTVGDFNDKIPYGCPLSLPGTPIICHTWFADQGTATQREMWCGTGSPPTSDFPCTIGARTVDIFYWPPTTRNGNLCTDGTTFTASNGTRLAYHTYTGNAYNSTIYTFTSPTVYMSFDVLTATYAQPGHAGGEWAPGVVGRAFYDKIVGIDPRSVSSLVAHVPGFQGSWQEELSYIIGHSDVSLTLTAEPYNFAHVEFPFPASAYFFGHDTSWLSNMYWWSISDRHSDTIYWEDGWLPTMSVPPELRSLDPAWARCAPNLAGIHDPPTVITAITTAFGPALPTIRPTTTPAAPANTPKPKPTPTMAPQPTTPAAPSSLTETNEATSSSEALVNYQDPQPSPTPRPGKPQATIPSNTQPGDNGATLVVPLDGTSIIALQTVILGNDGTQTTQVVLAGQTLTQGGAPIVISSHTVSVASGGVVIDGQQTYAIPSVPQQAASATAILTLNGQPVAATPFPIIGGDGHTSVGAVIDGQTLSIGGSAPTIGGQVVSLSPSGIVSDGSNTIAWAAPANSPAVIATATVTLQSARVTALMTTVTDGEGHIQSAAVIVTRTLQLNQAPMTIGGHTISLGSSGIIIDNRNTYSFTAIPTSMPVLGEAVLDFGTTSMLATEHVESDRHGRAQTEVVVHGTTLHPGQAVIIDGHVVAYESGHLVIDGRQTTAFSPAYSTIVQAVASLESMELGASEVVTTDASGHVRTLAVIDGTTLKPGATATIDGHVVAFTSNQLAIDGTQTIAFTPTVSMGRQVATLSINPSLTLSAFETIVTGRDGHATEEAIIGTATLIAGGPPITIDGAVISLASDGNPVVNGSKTFTFSDFSSPPSVGLSTSATSEDAGTTSRVAQSTTTIVSGGSAKSYVAASSWIVVCLSICLALLT